MNNMQTRNLLLEIGTEELPPKALRRLGTALHENFARQLREHDLSFSSIRYFATPRRLALLVSELSIAQADREIVIKGPPVRTAFTPDGHPTAAALGWARANNIELSEAQRLNTDKGEVLAHRTVRRGQMTAELVPALFERALSSLPIPKLMHWGSHDFSFVRPVHTLCMLFDDELLPGTLFGITSSRDILGHRFLCPAPLHLTSAIDYQRLLRSEGRVLADFSERKAEITRQIEAIAAAEQATADLDDDLLEEVTALVEWPRAYMACFEPEFLEVPAEALVYTMKGDQKYFPLYDAAGRLLPKFIFISNISPADPQAVITGNEKVIRPRLSDARFFFTTDRRRTLASFAPLLDGIIYQKDIGTLSYRSAVVAQLCDFIAPLLGADPQLTARAAALAKCDLVTTLVTEFTDLQGVAGMHYARLDGEPDEVANAIRAQYLPRFAGDELPQGKVALTLSIAEKLTTLCAICGVNLMPRGDSDPYGLRRAAIGLIRIVLENRLEFSLTQLVRRTCELLSDRLQNTDTAAQVTGFILQRLKAYYRDRHIGAEIFNAVYAVHPDGILDFDQRVHALIAFQALPEARDLASAYKRVTNLLGKAHEERNQSIHPELLHMPEERQLVAALTDVEPAVMQFYSDFRYEQALQTLAGLRQPVDDFFEKVLVNDPDPDIRSNRLAILNKLHQLFSGTADISVLY